MRGLLFLMLFPIFFPSLCWPNPEDERTLEGGDQTYAILVQGSKEPWTTNNLKLVYLTLIKRGVPKENIIVVSPLVSLAWKDGGLKNTLPDLDGDGRWDVKWGTTFNNVADAFKELGEKVKNHNAQIFLYFTMHGLKSRLCLESIIGENKDIESVELKEWLKKNFHGSQEITLFIEACYSGSFIEVFGREILDNNGREYLFFASADESKKSYWAPFKNGERYTDTEAQKCEAYDFGVFTYHFFSALNGSYPEGPLIPEADFDGSGIVSLEEAYTYACFKVADFRVAPYADCSLPVFECFQIKDLAPSPLMEPLDIPFDD